MKNLPYIFILFIFVAVGSSCSHSELDHYLDGAYDRTGMYKNYVDSLKRIRYQRALSVERMDAAEKLGKYYLKHDLDSALTYMRLAYSDALRLQDKDAVLRLRLTTDAYMPLNGMDLVALRDFELINKDSLDTEGKRLYFLTAAEMYFNIQNKMERSIHKNYFQQKTLAGIDSAMHYYEQKGAVYQFLHAYAQKLRGEESLSAAILAELLPKLSDRPDLYMRSAVLLADYYSQHPEKKDRYFKLLNDMALRGFREGVIRPNVLAQLGKQFYLRGDTDRGVALISMALTSKDVENGVFTIEDPSEYFVFLSEKGWRDQRLITAVIVTLLSLLILSAIGVYMQWRKQKKLTVLLRKSSRENSEIEARSKEHIRNGINLAVLSLDNLQEFNLYSMRKLTAGQVKGLLSELESGKLLQNYRDKFFKHFDERFLESRPYFIEFLNSLLREDARFAPLAQPVLSPELRIAAFMSLGFGDSAMLAQSLGLSLNTVYTYRNRLKGRALDRQDFERKLQELSFNPIC